MATGGDPVVDQMPLHVPMTLDRYAGEREMDREREQHCVCVCDRNKKKREIVSNSLMGSSAKGSLRKVLQKFCGNFAKTSKIGFIAPGKGAEIPRKLRNLQKICGTFSSMTPFRMTPQVNC